MKKNELVWVDFIRVAAIFWVVWLHSAAPLLSQYNKIPALDWWLGNIEDSVVRMCVPLLFMLSGYLLLEKQEPLKVYFQKRVNKLLIPFVVWSILYILWKQYYENSEAITLRSFYSLLFYPAYFHLWFLYTLIGLYLYIPILRILVQHASREILYYFIILWFMAVAVIPLLEKSISLGSTIDFKMISGYVGYLLLGHLLGNIQISKRLFVPALLIALICLIITVAGTFVLTAGNGGVFDGYFYDYLSPNVILLSASVFILLRALAERLNPSENQKTALQLFSSASFGIYLVHPMLLYAIKTGWSGYSWSVFSASPIISVPVMTILTFGSSFAITFLLLQIPLVRKCVS